MIEEKNKGLNPILIIVSMFDVEADFLLSKMENVKQKKVNQYEFYEGTIENYPVVIGWCHCMTVNAALATYIAIEKYHPIAIINQGSAGAHGKSIHKGDIVIGEKCMNIVSCRTPLKKEGEGSNSLEWELVNFICGEEDRLQYQEADKSLIELAKKVQYKEGTVHVGLIGSGDVWNKEADRILWLHETYGTLCEEMEGIAIYQVANEFGVPVLGIRIVSNNEILQEPYDREIAIKSQRFAYELILKIIEKFKNKGED